jgi:hypothetical protein
MIELISEDEAAPQAYPSTEELDLSDAADDLDAWLDAQATDVAPPEPIFTVGSQTGA